MSSLDVTDEDLGRLQGLQLSSLLLNGCFKLTNSCLGVLKYMPISRLHLFPSVTDAGLEDVSEMPLTSLSLMGCDYVTNEGLRKIQGLSLTCLNLSFCHWLSDLGLKQLKGLPISDLDLYTCEMITDVGIGHLSGLPLTHIRVKGCSMLSFECKMSLLARVGNY